MEVQLAIQTTQMEVHMDVMETWMCRASRKRKEKVEEEELYDDKETYDD